MSTEITRREFIKLSAGGLMALFVPKDLKIIQTPELSKSPNPLVNAVKLPTLEYHDPNFNAGDACMTPEVFTDQLDWLRKANYYTPNAKEIAGFLRGEILLPFNSVAIRFDLGTDKINPNTSKSIWPEVFEKLKERNLHAIIFLIADTVETLPNGLSWQALAEYVKNDTISICSHGLKDHPDYKHISQDYALYSMRESKEKIKMGLQKAGIDSYEPLGFAFPFDSVPENAQELVEKAGFQFFAGGVKKNGLNAACFGQYQDGLPTIYPYVYREDIKSREENTNNNLALLDIKGGSSFIDTITTNQNDIIKDKNWEKYQLNIWEQKTVPEEIFTNRLLKANAIIVHTDSQKGDYKNWKSENTFWGINGQERKVAVTFGVDQSKILQFVPLYLRDNSLFIPEPKYDSQAAKGISSAINIEMAGGQFDQILEKGSKEEKKTVEMTIAKTAVLILQLFKISNGQLNINNVFGHLEMTVRGKSDPGKMSIEILRRMLLNNSQNFSRIKIV